MTPLKLLSLLFTLLLSLTASAQTLISPANGSSVPAGAYTTVSWNPGASNLYQVNAGNGGCGSTQYLNYSYVYAPSSVMWIPPGTTGTLSVSVTGYWPQYGTACWQFPIGAAPTAPTIISPANGSVVVPWQWLQISSSSWPITVSVGTSGAGSCQIWCADVTNSFTFGQYGIPALPYSNTATNTYIRVCRSGLCSDYTFANAPVPVLSDLTSPVNGSTLTSSTQLFQWTLPSGVTANALWVGTGGVGSSNVYSSGWLTGNSVTVAGLPSSGGTLYIRLDSLVNNATQWISRDYTLTASTGAPDPLAGVNGSQFISATGSQVVPPNDPVAYAGMKFTVNVTWKNTGTRVWIANDPVKPTRMAAPGWENTWTYGYDPRSYMAPGTLVYPNQSYTFSKEYTAPSTPGVYNLNIQMVQDAVAFFGAIQTWSITVVQAPIQPTEFTAFPALPPETVADEFTGGTTLMRSLENPGTQLLAENSSNHPIYGDAAVKQTDTFQERAVGLQPGSHFYVLLVRMKLDGSGTEAIPKPAALGPVFPPGSPWWCYTWAQECETPPSGWGGIPLLWAFGTVNPQGQVALSGNYGNLEPSRQPYIEDWVVVNAAGQTVHLKNTFFVTFPSGDLPL